MSKVSIITVCFNSVNDIENAVLSVLNQTFQDYEYIIIDGASTDGTLDILKKYENRITKIVSEKDAGIYDAMNKGLEISSGEWIYFLGSDDVLYNDNILDEVFVNSNYEKYDFIYGDVIFKNSGFKHSGEFSKFRIINENICHQSIFTKKEVFQKLGNFQTKYITYADWVFNIYAFGDRKIKHKYINKIVAVFNENGFSVNRNDVEFKNDKVKIIKENFSVFTRNLNLRKRTFPFNIIVKFLEFLN